MATATAFAPDDLEDLGFVRVGQLLEAEGVRFESIVRSGLTMVPLRHGTRIRLPSVSDRWQHSTRTDRSVMFSSRSGSAIAFGGGEYQLIADLTDSKGDPMGDVSLEWGSDGVAEVVGDPDGMIVRLRVYSGLPDASVGGAVPVYATEGAWHRAVIDIYGSLWVDPRRETGIVSLLTGELVDLSRMDDLGYWSGGPRFGRHDTTCGEPGQSCGASVPASGRAPFDGTLLCQARRDDDGFGLVLRGEEWVLEFGRFALDRCPDGLPIDLLQGEPLTVGTGGRLVQVRGYSPDGQPVDTVVSRDGQLFIGNAGTTLTCPPCLSPG
jgi:hypothetical protein